MKSIISIDMINKLSKGDFISIFGNVFEKTIWIAEKTFISKPFKNYNEILSILIKTYDNSSKEELLKIFNAHPELAVEKKLTDNSRKEQNNANLNQCSDQEFIEFTQLNLNYKKKFSFPYIIAVKGKKKEEILENFKKRLTNNIKLEFEEAKEQVKKIAIFRIKEIIN